MPELHNRYKFITVDKQGNKLTNFVWPILQMWEHYSEVSMLKHLVEHQGLSNHACGISKYVTYNAE